jgi:glutamate racemase
MNADDSIEIPIDSAQPVGMFDSGVGGLTVLKALRERLPGEDVLYLGDTARLPYGTKSPQTVTRYAVQAAGALVRRGIKMLVVACNTASAVALDAVREAYPGLAVVGVVEPGARAACAASRNGIIAVVATEGTIAGGAYHRAIAHIRPEAHIKGQPCPLFVSLAEEGWVDGPIAEAVVARYLEPVFSLPEKERPDSLVLGCTHFPLLEPAIRAVLGKGVRIVDSAATTAEVVHARLAESAMLSESNGPGKARFLTTDDVERFARTGTRFLGTHIGPEQVDLVDL